MKTRELAYENSRARGRRRARRGQAHQSSRRPRSRINHVSLRRRRRRRAATTRSRSTSKRARGPSSSPRHRCCPTRRRLRPTTADSVARIDVVGGRRQRPSRRPRATPRCRTRRSFSPRRDRRRAASRSRSNPVPRPARGPRRCLRSTTALVSARKNAPVVGRGSLPPPSFLIAPTARTEPSLDMDTL